MSRPDRASSVRGSRARKTSSVVLAGSMLAAGIVSVGMSTAASGAINSDALILADTNRDGSITAADASGRDVWTKDRGALFLANMDDDSSRCPTVGPNNTQLTDVELASCFDAADKVVNGDSDILDLARVKVQPVAASKADSARIELRGVGASKVNVFIKNNDGKKASDWKLLPANGALPADRIVDGIELGVEGKDIIRDESWDGTVTIRVVHNKAGKKVAGDQVKMRVAPLLFVTDRMPIEKLYMADNKTSVYDGVEMGEYTPRDLATQKNADNMAADFLAGIARMGGDVQLEKLPSMQGARGGGNGTDIWTQDIMEPGVMSMPSADGEQQIRVFVRAPVRDGRDNAGDNPFRQTGRVVFTKLRGPDVAGIQHFDPDYQPEMIPGQSYDTRGSTGNYGTIPAYEHDGKKYPLGRKVYGAVPGTGFTADPAFNKMLELQGFQDPIVVDTSWLSVGHIDEFMSIIPADNDRGWALVAADPHLAVNLLKELVEDGRGDERLYTPYDLVPAEGSTPPAMTVGEAVTDPSILKGAEVGHAGVNKALRILKAEAGLTEDDIIRVPVLYKANQYGRVGVQVPNAANLIGTGHNVVLIPKQHVPAVDGKDLFQGEIEKRFAEIGTQIQWAEDYFYTNRGGQIHCVTNALRDTTYGDSWWTEGDVTEEPPTALKQFTTLSQPSVSGVFKAGRTIRVHTGAMRPAPTTVKYQWFRGKTPIKGATSATLKLKKAWRGQVIRVGISSARSGYRTVNTVTSIGALPRDFATKRKATIKGKFRVGGKISVKAPVLKPKASKITYRWYANNKAIKGATKKKLALKRSLKGKRIKVVVTAQRAGYTPLKTTVKVNKGKRLR